MDELGTQGSMQLILIGILVLCGYLALLKYVYDHAANRAAFPILAIFLLIIYGVLFGGLMMVLSQLGSAEYTFMGILLLGACVTVFVMLAYLMRHFREMNKGALSLFVMYLLVVAYLTIFNRKGQSDTSILTGFTSFQEAIEKHSLQPLNHFLLNIIMFMPLMFASSLKVSPPSFRFLFLRAARDGQRGKEE